MVWGNLPQEIQAVDSCSSKASLTSESSFILATQESHIAFLSSHSLRLKKKQIQEGVIV